MSRLLLIVAGAATAGAYVILHSQLRHGLAPARFVVLSHRRLRVIAPPPQFFSLCNA